MRGPFSDTVINSIAQASVQSLTANLLSSLSEIAIIGLVHRVTVAQVANGGNRRFEGFLERPVEPALPSDRRHRNNHYGK